MERLNKVRKLMRDKSLDWIVLLRTSHIEEPVINHLLDSTVEDSVLIISKKKCLLFTSPLTKLKVPKEFKVESIVDVRKFLSGKFGLKIGVNYSRLPMSFSKLLKKAGRLVKIDEELAGLRVVKEPYEVQRIRTACNHTEDILRRCFLDFKGFRTERDVQRFLLEEASVFDGPAFEPIVASGRNSGIPHYTPQKVPLKDGFCIIDFGIKLKGYRSDISRTVFIGSPELKDLKNFNLVLQAKDSAFNAIRPGVKACDLDKIARDLLKDRLKHSLGHGVGVDIHENPFLRPKSKEIIQKGSVFTLEPGIYSSSFGIRIEDMVHLKNRPVWLSHSKGLLIVPRPRKR